MSYLNAGEEGVLTTIITFCELDKVEALKELLEEYVNIVPGGIYSLRKILEWTYRALNHLSLLHAYCTKREILKIFLSYRPILYSTRWYILDFVQYLFEQAPENFDLLADNPDAKQLLVKRPYTLQSAIRNSNMNNLSKILDVFPFLINAYSVDVNFPTPICFAAFLGNRPIVSFLLERGASPNVVSLLEYNAYNYIEVVYPADVIPPLNASEWTKNIYSILQPITHRTLYQRLFFYCFKRNEKTNEFELRDNQGKPCRIYH